MKALLSSLLCFVLLESQVFAIHGGPAASAGAAGVAGTYAGLLIPRDDSSTGANSLGLFTFNIGTTGLGTGTSVVFSGGRVFTGTVTAFGDSGNARIQGLIETSFNYTLHVPVTTVTGNPPVSTTTISDISVTANATGTFDSFVEPATDIISGTTFRIAGTAKLNIDQGQVNDDGSPVITDTVEFTVDGVQQSAG